MKKKGQVTLFVIIAMIIVVAGALVFTISGEVRTSSSDADENPRLFLKDCIEDDFLEAVEIVSMNGGSIDPEFYHKYYDANVEYLCSTSRPYVTCVVQRPFLKAHIEEELTNELESKILSCKNELESNLRESGYTVNEEFQGYKISVLPERVELKLDYDLTMTKSDTNRYTDFTINLNSNLYELVGVAKSIVEWETLLGDAEVKEYSAIYHNLEIRKNRVSDEDKIYVIKDRKTGDTFQFATRSLVFPPGLI